ncbi:MAG TPA: APC family permease [Thermodesulfobacteriota bacterium]|nr:APC family permease [Thermodesulfobacteriota bacterium]
MPAEQGSQPRLKTALGFWQLLFYGVAFMVPIAPIVIYGVVTQVTGGHMAMAYLLAMVAMFFTAASYGQMAGEFPEAGSTYSYTRHGLNPHLGMLAGWTILLDYVLMPALSYVVIAIFGSQLLPDIPYWFWVAIPLIAITFINILGVKQMAGTTVVLLLLQLGVLGYFFMMAILGISRGMGQGFTLRPFFSENFQLGAVIAGTSIACFSFLGFDAISTLAEETKRPRMDISRATLAACLLAGFLFIAQAFLAQNIWPNYSSFPNLDAAFYFIAEQVGGQPLSVALTLGMIFAALANAVDAQAASARLLFGMGRDGVLPQKVFGALNARTKTPVLNLLIMAVIGAAVATQTLDTIVSLINFGALFGFLLVNLSVIRHHFITRKKRDSLGVIKCLIVPFIGAAICFILWINLPSLSKIAGFIWLGLGIIYEAFLTDLFRKDPPYLRETL